MAVAPNSLDPAVGDTPQAFEADWLVYTPLLTYHHSIGVPGTVVIPGLADALPTISDGGRTYTLGLIPGLVYSTGQAVKASDFTWAVERAIKLRWGGASQFVEGRIVGASAFAAGRASTISGISTNDATGQITIHLTAPYGAFDDVLAFPALAPVPRQTPLHDEQRNPPPGVGPYRFGAVLPGHSFSLVVNPRWHRGVIRGVPMGHLGVTVKVTGDGGLDARLVLRNAADVLDYTDRIPLGALAQIHRQASARYSKQPLDATYLIFLNVTRRPFSNELARVAVQTGLDEIVLKGLAPETLQEGCYLIPPSMYGHPHNQCPRGDIEKGGNLASAKALVARSGMAGTRVTVWSEADSPASRWMAYYAAMLDQIGFRARVRLVPPRAYYSTIGELKLHPQTGLGYLNAAVPTPQDFYERLTGSESHAGTNQNWGQINDPYLNRQVRILSAVPSSNLGAVAGFWHELERYVAGKAYVAVFGYQTAPEFVSDRLVYSRLVFSPVAGLDWTSFRLK
jgi:peptide/nickel transport system substrate-binding protein